MASFHPHSYISVQTAPSIREFPVPLPCKSYSQLRTIVAPNWVCQIVLGCKLASQLCSVSDNVFQLYANINMCAKMSLKQQLAFKLDIVVIIPCVCIQLLEWTEDPNAIFWIAKQSIVVPSGSAASIGKSSIKSTPEKIYAATRDATTGILMCII